MFLVLNSIKINGFSFVVAVNDVIEELKTSSENLNTSKIQIYWLEYLRNWQAGQH